MRLYGSTPLSSLQKININDLPNVADEDINESIDLTEKQQNDYVLALYNKIKTYDCNNLNKREQENVELILSKKYMHFLGISEYITKNYKVEKHINF